jgi:hypothetical protein
LNNNAKHKWLVIIKEKKSSRITHAYKVGDKVLLKEQSKHLRKLEAPRTGPHTLTAVDTNVTMHYTTIYLSSSR